jgi:NADPH:quinone reductase-like Zn-dependent oxidoreductase
MKAIKITSNKDEPIQLIETQMPEFADGDCLVKIHAAALNRRDQWMREGLYPGITFGTTLGSDGCGVVERGPEEWIGKSVIINPNINWGNNPEVQSRDYSILGMPTDGTLAQYVKVPTDRLVEKPTHLSDEAAASIPLAGLTAYRAVVTKGKVNASKRVLITGIGGGVSQFALQFALALGATVFVTSRDEEKRAKAMEMGAKDGFITSSDDWWKDVLKVGQFDVIIDSTGGNSVNTFLKIIKPAGRIVLYGSTAGYPERLDTFRLFWTQAQIMGSTMGNDDEFAAMVQLVADHTIQPTVDRVFEMKDYLMALDRFKAPDHVGKIVLRIS